jgi:hypothetical protein
MTAFVVIGNTSSNRVTYFQAALAQAGLPPARLITYQDLIRDQACLTFSPGDIVRIESPGKDFEVERALLKLGTEVPDPEGGYERIVQHALDALSFDKGRILPSRQWYLGYSEVLGWIETAVAGHQVMNTPADIRLMFDKRACHAYLQAKGIPVPPCLGPFECYDELLTHMQARHISSVFIKLAHGSSASGAVAYRTNGRQHQAISTCEMVDTNGKLHLYNSRQMQAYDRQGSIAALIDALCRHRVHVEQWIPKAGYDGQAFDLRVVVIAQQVRHVVARLSHSPMTNLHLLNKRGDVEAILAAIGEAAWSAAKQTCEAAARSFASLYSGIDLLFTPSYRKHVILEMNAFGDLLPGIVHHGQDTYLAEILAVLEGT